MDGFERAAPDRQGAHERSRSPSGS
jgi:hypothetical protein